MVRRAITRDGSGGRGAAAVRDAPDPVPGRTAVRRRVAPAHWPSREVDAARLTVHGDLAALEHGAHEWDELAERAGSPFLTVEWICSWWEGVGDGEPLCLVMTGHDGRLLAGACCRRAPGGRLTAPTDPSFSEEWDVVAADDGARRAIWREVARRAPGRVMLTPLHTGAAAAAAEALEAEGYRVLRRVVRLRPYRPLPDTLDELLASLGSRTRWEWRRRRRDLEAAGGYELRVAKTTEGLERDLELLLRLEASGWKGREGTAIVQDPGAERLYRNFTRRAAEQGWLRLSFLENGSETIAASLGVVFAGKAWRLKSGFDERRADHSPGFVLSGEELRCAIEEGLREYDFLGMLEEHKRRLGAQTRPLFTLYAYRGIAGLPPYLARAKLRPLLGRLRRRLRSGSGGGAGGPA